MIKAFFLIFEPAVAWDKISQARRDFAKIFFLYLLPMVVLATAVEGWGLARWGKWQPKYDKLKAFSTGTVITFEVIQLLLLLAMVLVSALLLLRISQTFETRRSYLQAFTTMAYGFSPLFLTRLLDAGPMMSPWVTWLIGLALTVWILYQGIPRIIQPDPTHAFGLYLSAMFVVLLTSGIARVLTALYLLGEVDFHHSWLTRKFPALLQ
jgi:Yip1 domain